MLECPASMKTRITWFEGVALLVEKKFPIGHGPWMIAYLVAIIALLPSVLNLGIGTGMAACGYATQGLFASAPFSAGTTLLINLFCTALGWFLSSWLVLVWRLFQCHRKEVPYTSPCYLWISGAVLLAYQVLAVVAVFLARSTTFGSMVPVLLILALHYVHKTICRL